MKRVYPDEEGHIHLHAGEYGKDGDGLWYIMPPGMVTGCGVLSKHKVTEHEDGTITVSPSILITNHTGQWHGFLERGVWRKC